MRIIAGTLKGRRLQTPPPGTLAIRPTADRAREALFSILLKWPRGPFLDLFAGTGAVGLEALSRGYAPVACVELQAACLQANVAGSGVALLRADALKLDYAPFRDQAVIFGDPPYERSGALWDALAPKLAPCLAPEGVLVWETDQRAELAAPASLRRMDSRRYGAARFHFFQLG